MGTIKKIYFLNTKTGTLHIKGYCKFTKSPPYEIAFFNTEDEALSYGGTAIKMCKNCQKKKEEQLKN